ncbi:Ppx/GppA phosphatase family protein [Romboutsia sp. 1001216sp1]|uniref:Ppx/GppA phosphatase family protein n=1 Tax=Romboutsia TaxID=1501226 RepID=UPI000B23999F|nr:MULTISPECIES: Ppx/GppA phosphatase family protein [Romboutsia]MDB8794356.1 Ppx/GppA phosphatase family protein [Romboutsia sp. 1001216sp1]MDB8797307.1 Ppx/GppA phosphatase family protein [Romboutsia sp. 1001216sp1]MDB8800183.1 Ppx/GppA phosphatase family protein [Romboutsia sp. 1001216sp1]
MKIGAIDIGTNSMRLLVADYINGKIENRKKFINTTRIGQGVDKEGYINKEAIDRNIKALETFSDICKEEGCEKIYAMGTSALRDSKNKNEFIDLAKEKTGIDIEIISGVEESNLGFKGVLEGLNEKDNILVIDIGGGSTEFIIGNRKGISFAKSENVGALRMTEKFLKKDPIDNKEFEDMEFFIENTLKDTLEYIKSCNISYLVGIGGTITSLSAINQELEVYSMEKIHNSEICKKDIDIVLQSLKNMTLNDKKRLKGLQPKRADIITAGVKILDKIMEKLESQKIIVSEYDNLEGLICQKSKNMS